MDKDTHQRQYEVISDGVTVWVNGRMSLLGRFGRMGIDIHRPLEEQCVQGECLFCTHGLTTEEDWELFKKKMRECFGVSVTDKHKPKRFLPRVGAGRDLR